MTFGSLFAGIGGLDLGLERAGMECKWQVEIDDYARRVLAKHWPNVRRWDDIKTFPTDALRPKWEPGPRGRRIRESNPQPSPWIVDLICGGFPCQDISTAGKRAGLHGDRSGLFFEAIRVVELLQPRWLLLENVAGLLARGLDEVLGTLASIGFDAEWHCLQAADFGAPHIRDRVFILAHTQSAGVSRKTRNICKTERRPLGQLPGATEFSGEIPNTNSQHDRPRHNGDAATFRATAEKGEARGPVPASEFWATEPDVGRVAHGIPSRVDRLRGIGNAVVPQIAEWIGRQIMEADN